MRSCHHPHQSPSSLLPSGWENFVDSPSPRSLSHNLFANDWCALIILSEEFWKNILKTKWNFKKIFNILFCNLDFRKFLYKIWHWLHNTIFHAKKILTGDVNLDEPDISSTVRVQIFIDRYFAVVAEEIQIRENLISRFMFIFSMFYLKIVRFFFHSWLFSRFGLDCENKIQKFCALSYRKTLNRSIPWGMHRVHI